MCKSAARFARFGPANIFAIGLMLVKAVVSRFETYWRANLAKAGIPRGSESLTFLFFEVRLNFSRRCPTSLEIPKEVGYSGFIHVAMFGLPGQV